MKEDPLPIILNLLYQINVDILHLENLIVFCMILVLLVFSALISGAEVSYFSLTMSDLESLKENKLIIKLLKFPNSLLATILIVNNFINVAIIILSSYLTTISIVFAENSVLEFIFQVVIITCLLVLFGEITPKVYANHNAIKFSLWMAKPLTFLNKAL